MKMKKVFVGLMLMFVLCSLSWARDSQLSSIGLESALLSTQGVALVQFHIPYGLPMGTPESNKLIARPIYCMSNNSETKFADWVAFRLDVNTVSGSSVKKRNWKADPALAEDETLEPEDYKGAHAKLNTDRGHQAPLASFKGTGYWHHTNYLSNITPQHKDLNQGAWKKIEDRVRELALRQPVYVMTGPLYEREMGSLPGADEPHRVPSGYWKIVAVQGTGPFDLKIVGYIFDQATPRGASPSDYVATVDDVESRSGLDFFWLLPDIAEDEVEKTVSLSLH